MGATRTSCCSLAEACEADDEDEEEVDEEEDEDEASILVVDGWWL